MPHKIADPDKFPIWRQFSEWTRSSIDHIFEEAPFKPKTYNNQRICPLGMALYIEYGAWIGFPYDIDVARTIFRRNYPYEPMVDRDWCRKWVSAISNEYGDAYIRMVREQAEEFINYWEENRAKVA